MKKIFKILIVAMIVILLCIFSLSYTINKNNNYEESIAKEIKANYPITEEIQYTNYYGNYYIFTTEKQIVVLNNEFQEVKKENLDKLAENKNNYEIIYKNNKLMYEKTNLEKNKVTYEYYDATNNKKISSSILEK